jgi:hypothetical protein
MADKKPSPLQASFWFTEQEKRYILVIAALFLLGLAARFYFMKTEQPEIYTPEGIEKLEQEHE